MNNPTPRHKIRAVTLNGMTYYAYAATSAGARNALIDTLDISVAPATPEQLIDIGRRGLAVIGMPAVGGEQE